MWIFLRFLERKIVLFNRKKAKEFNLILLYGRGKGRAKVLKFNRSVKLCVSVLNKKTDFSAQTQSSLRITEKEYSLGRPVIVVDAAWDGIKEYITNTKLSTKKVIENYGQPTAGIVQHNHPLDKPKMILGVLMRKTM